MSDTNALVSIIVPVYGTEDYLPSCLDSVCSQTYTDIQIILVDDGSPDKCPQICDSYAERDSRITVIHQENKGVSGARNNGLRCATGEYIMFVDSDDELYPDAVDILVQDACKHNADIVWAPFKNSPSDNDSEDELEILRDESSLLLSLDGADNMNSACGKLFSSDFIKGLFFEEGRNINEDGFFMFQCYVKKPVIVRHNAYVYRYNTRDGSSSHSAFSEKYLDMLYFSEQKKELIAKLYPQYLERAYNMQVRTHLLFLQVLCRTDDKKYKSLCKESIRAVRRLRRYHRPVNSHHKKLELIVVYGLFSLYKFAVRLKYYR